MSKQSFGPAYRASCLRDRFMDKPVDSFPESNFDCSSHLTLPTPVHSSPLHTRTPEKVRGKLGKKQQVFADSTESVTGANKAFELP